MPRSATAASSDTVTVPGDSVPVFHPCTQIPLRNEGWSSYCGSGLPVNWMVSEARRFCLRHVNPRRPSTAGPIRMVHVVVYVLESAESTALAMPLRKPPATVGAKSSSQEGSSFHPRVGIRIASSTATTSVMFSPATIWYLRQSLGSQMVPGSAQLSLNPTVMVFRYWSSDG